MNQEMQVRQRDKAVLYSVMGISMILALLGFLFDGLEPMLVCGLILFFATLATFGVYLYSIKYDSKITNKA